MRYDWPGGPPCGLEFRRGGKAYRCDDRDRHKHVQHRAVNDGPVPRETGTSVTSCTSGNR